MDNEKELKRAELSDDEIDAVSGGYFASQQDYSDALNIAQTSENDNLKKALYKMSFDPFNSYTAEDIKKLL